VDPSGRRTPVGKDNLVLRECILKNTDFVEGIVVYAGHESKAMMNNGGPRHKISKVKICLLIRLGGRVGGSIDLSLRPVTLCNLHYYS
jgi:hypothetical protein